MPKVRNDASSGATSFSISNQLPSACLLKIYTEPKLAQSLYAPTIATPSAIATE